MADDIDPQTATSGTVADLKNHLDTVQTPEQIEALRQAEEDGKARATALAAIDAKAATLDAVGSDPVDENVTSAPAADEAKKDGNAEVDANKPVTVLAEVPHPKNLTSDDIKSISGADGSDDEDASQQQRDAAEALELTRDQAETDDEPERGYMHGMGPGADIG